MDNVQFDEEKVNNQFFRRSQTYKGLIGLIIKAKLAKNEVQANLVLIGIIIVCIVGVVFILIANNAPKTVKTNTPPLTVDQVRQLMQSRR